MKSRLGLVAAVSLALFGVACSDDGGEFGKDQQDFTGTWMPAAIHEGNLRIATFNIRNYPMAEDLIAEGKHPAAYKLETDEAELIREMKKLNPDMFVVQEIRDPVRFQSLLEGISKASGRSYQGLLAENEWNLQRVGLAVDTTKLEIVSTTEHPEVDVKGTMRDGLSARIKSRKQGGIDFSVMVLHLASGASASRGLLRKQQAEIVAKIVTDEKTLLGDDDYLVLGDMNTQSPDVDLPLLDAAFGTAALTRQENEIGCSAYFGKEDSTTVNAALIDQVYATGLTELDTEVPVLSGTHCAIRQCRPFKSSTPQSGRTYWDVSDHCPVYFEVKDVDDDAASKKP